MKYVIAILLVFLISGCISTEYSEQNLKAQDISKFSITSQSDKAVYSSREQMQISVSVESPVEKENALIRINGINPRGYAYIDLLEAVNLTAGENDFNFSSTTPSCTSGCGGVLPGDYLIDVELLNGSEVLCNASFRIELVS